MTSGYAYETAEEAEARFKGEIGGYQYSRFGNPTVSMFEERMALLEGAAVGRATATGMAAVTAVFLSSLRTGDHVVAARAMFGSCLHVVEQVLPRFGITYTLVDGADTAAWEAAMRPQTKLLFLETPSNPTLSLVDIAAVAKIANRHGARLVVDNAFASPALQRPLEFGAHIVIHSSTKYIDGQGRALGGVVLCDQDFLDQHLQVFLRNTGPAISPFNAWLHLKSLETLELRMKQHCENAQRVADFLGQKSDAGAVSFPSRSSAAQSRQDPDGRRRWRGDVRSDGWQGGSLSSGQCAAADRHFQQSGRRQEPHHPSRDHHSFQSSAGRTHRTWHHARPDARFDRPGGC
jgi:O-succinylhomoserine sulfhydrylase